MYIAMNRFQVLKGHEDAFETVWRERESRLDEMDGFEKFNLLKGPHDEEKGITLYASHTVWRDKDSFLAWTKSDQFRAAHKNAGDGPKLTAGHPQFEGFESVLGS